jgi:16S rRNA (cytosine1402-N4)-methyltransferase
MEALYHVPVMLDEVVRYLLTDAGGIYVDATVGGGGHAEAICNRLNAAGRLICFDVDEKAIELSRARLRRFQEHVSMVHSNFGNLKTDLEPIVAGRIHGLLLDLGVSSFQLDEGSRGFSFRVDERIDMRMDRRQLLGGWDVVNTYEEKALARILWEYGEERNSRRLAKRIVEGRPVHTTGALSHIVEVTAGKRFLTKTLARVFQAIRIEVNSELENLKTVLTDSIDLLAFGGRIVVISYHSLEDRVVKSILKEEAVRTTPSVNMYVANEKGPHRLRLLTKKPVRPTTSEVQRNPRSRSARMRAAERIP